MTLTFQGFLFETLSSPLTKKVRRAEIRTDLGFKALTQIRHLGLEPARYKQFFIEMEGTDPNYKVELVGAYEKFELKRC